MEYLKKNPEEYINKLPTRIISNYDCFCILKDYIPTEFYNNYLNSINEYKLKNIWNHIVIRWIKMKNNMVNDKDYLTSIYSKQNYNHIHTMITHKTLNQLLNSFIGSDLFKALFVVNCIQNHFKT